MTAEARDDAATPDRPRLVIISSSEEGRRRLDTVAEDLLSRMPHELAASLARSTITFALDGVRHGGFAQGMGGWEDGVERLAEERVRQRGERAEHLTIIVLRLDEQHRVPNDAQLLAHELGHAALGHTNARLLAANHDDREQIERDADAWASRWLPEW